MGALSFNIRHVANLNVADLNVVKSGLHRGFVCDRQGFMGGSRDVLHVKVGIKGSEVNGHITIHFLENPIDHSFQVVGVIICPGDQRVGRATQHSVSWTA